ncbi:leucyl aminopeptidase [Agromyces sp. CFH 90414]|uniref:Probable cytosol aminopeptidase n=1 Tax=Agromyces agglutinans TaxID=2662258 RepID=A0A6I2F8N6_9MICO|nr:leucyl aminopeptidase [Agromyces agglutinans]MRG58363.1 leucyl aminopeptidase [Agromyces agglutinans]
MSAPILALLPSPAAESDADALVLFAMQGGEGPTLLDDAGIDWVGDALGALGASGAAEELTRLPGRDGGPRVILVVGVGERVDAPAARLAAGAALRQAGEVDRVGLALDGASADVVAAALEGAGLGAYRFTAYRSEPKAPPARVEAHSRLDADAVGLERVRVVVAAVAATKDLVNTTPGDLTPEAFADLARTTGESAGLGVRVWDVEALEEGGFGGILDVGRGSQHAPRLVRIEHAPADAAFTLALVGKGITFDSGGLSLKPAASMIGMKTDMAGAAAVLRATIAAAELGLPIRIVGWLCLAENMPSSTALRPTDVIRIKGGTTVEVINTDAEGRLVLADGLVAAGEEQPDAIVDVATLTGAQVVALGHRVTGLMGDPDLVERVRLAADDVDEAMWPMPLPDYLRSTLKSDVADLANAKLGTVIPGMALAGVFLREFVGRRDGSDTQIPWAHLDFAGPSNNTGPGWGFTGSGATGATVRTLIRLAERLAAG